VAELEEPLERLLVTEDLWIQIQRFSSFFSFSFTQPPPPPPYEGS
jgi:hypothetical protein